MSRSFCPQLSEAQHLLPLLRSHLIATASGYPLPTGLALDLLPIVEDGLFGYELVPDRKTHTYVTIGCNAQGEPVLRQTLSPRRDDDLVFVTQKSRSGRKAKGPHRCNPLFIWRARQDLNPRPPGS